MSIFNLYSKRKKATSGEAPDVFKYDVIPHPLRIQIIYLLRDTLGAETLARYHPATVAEAYRQIVKILKNEFGVFDLCGEQRPNEADELFNFILSHRDNDQVLDAIELSFSFIDKFTRNYAYLSRDGANEAADAALSELNYRFKEHGIGYQFVSGEIIRVDSQLIHAEVVKPALSLLNSEMYAGAEEEFLKAFEHYRHGNTKEALVEALKSIESVIKSICKKRGWTVASTAPAKDLIQICFDKGLIPSFWQSHFSGLRSILEAGVPTARNKLGGHGQGDQVTPVPGHLAAYVLHQTASAIVFLVESEKCL